MIDAIPAATVVIVRDAPDGLETLMLRKTRGQSFGGMWVFPGGRLEASDADPCAAAVREAQEETGLLLTAADLVPYSRWTPPHGAPKRFDTWFFVAGLPAGAADVAIDGGEIGDQFWAHPGEVLARHGRGELELAPPTWVTLHRLARCVDVAAVLDDARSGEVEHFTTCIVFDPDGRVVCLWHGDAGYDSAAWDAPGPRHRLVMHNGPWEYVRQGSSEE